MTDKESLLRAVAAMGSQVALADALRIKPANVGMWLNGTKDIPARWCMPIEIVTEGRVRASELRPDLFDREFISKSLVVEDTVITRKYFDFTEEKA